MSKSGQHYLSFKVGQQWYGINVNNVIEVLHMVALVEVPTADPDTLGLITLRDEVIPVIDLRHRFGIAQPVFSLSTPILAIRVGQDATGFVVDEVDNVEQITEAQLITYNGPAILQVSGIARLAGRLLLLIDIETIGVLRQLHSPELRAALAEVGAETPDMAP